MLPSPISLFANRSIKRAARMDLFPSDVDTEVELLQMKDLIAR